MERIIRHLEAIDKKALSRDPSGKGPKYFAYFAPAHKIVVRGIIQLLKEKGHNKGELEAAESLLTTTGYDKTGKSNPNSSIRACLTAIKLREEGKDHIVEPTLTTARELLAELRAKRTGGHAGNNSVVSMVTTLGHAHKFLNGNLDEFTTDILKEDQLNLNLTTEEKRMLDEQFKKQKKDE